MNIWWSLHTQVSSNHTVLPFQEDNCFLILRIIEVYMNCFFVFL